MTFVLLNIILCGVGTLWSRVNARREETGIRQALGETQWGIRNLYLLEGICLLCIAALLAMVIEYQFVHAGMIETMGRGRGNLVDSAYLTDRTIPRFLITNGITWLIMAAVIFAAIWIPARRAAAMQAADALHYE
jgi:ABC-type antimicrobial peptide transport system permease subunit